MKYVLARYPYILSYPQRTWCPPCRGPCSWPPPRRWRWPGPPRSSARRTAARWRRARRRGWGRCRTGAGPCWSGRRGKPCSIWNQMNFLNESYVLSLFTAYLFIKYSFQLAGRTLLFRMNGFTFSLEPIWLLHFISKVHRRPEAHANVKRACKPNQSKKEGFCLYIILIGQMLLPPIVGSGTKTLPG